MRWRPAKELVVSRLHDLRDMEYTAVSVKR